MWTQLCMHIREDKHRVVERWELDNVVPEKCLRPPKQLMPEVNLPDFCLAFSVFAWLFLKKKKKNLP